MNITTKSQAIAIFGSVKALAEALNITSPAISQWQEDLNLRQQNEIIGAAVQAGLLKLRRTGSARPSS